MIEPGTTCTGVAVAVADAVEADGKADVPAVDGVTAGVTDWADGADVEVRESEP